MPPKSEIVILLDMHNYIDTIDFFSLGPKEIKVYYFCTSVLNLFENNFNLDHGEGHPPTIADLLNKFETNEDGVYDDFIAIYNEMMDADNGVAVAARVLKFLGDNIAQPPMNLDGGRRKFRKSRKTNRKYKANKTNRRNRNRTYRKRYSRRR